MPKYEKIVTKGEKKYFYRFSVHQRIQHVVLFSCVIILALTGFPLRHPDEAWSRPLYDFMGGTSFAPTLHRFAGTILLLLFVYHTIYWITLFFKNRIAPLKAEGKLGVRSFLKAVAAMEMMPNMKDVKDIIHLWKYLLYFTNKPPQHERMSWREKFDYFAPYWGIPILGPAGVILWWRDEVSQFLPGIVLNAAYIMHTDEALLAVLFLFFVHWYNVHYAPEKFPAATVWLTGYLTEEEMIHEHYAEYVRVMKEEGRELEIKPQH
ncbi:MAG: cytochrome b/b6 domain-containing protein [Candidatus Thiodiazotropha sp.]